LVEMNDDGHHLADGQSGFSHPFHHSGLQEFDTPQGKKYLAKIINFTKQAQTLHFLIHWSVSPFQ